MPAIVGPVKISSVSGVVQFGDSINLSPKSNSKTNAGSGGLNTGAFINTNNGFSNTSSYDPDVADQTQTANA